MIKYPEKWQGIGCKVDVADIGATIQWIIQKLNVRNLSLSGGIDSTLLLYFMKRILGDPIHCYTIALDETHPDYIHAKMATKYFDVAFHPCFLRTILEPDNIVKAFYGHLSAIGVEEIIAGDGIDEFTCGYYSHQNDQSEQNYISWIRRLHDEQLVPLNNNSGDVRVYLPYLSPEVVSLLSLIPLFDKVDDQYRKKIMRTMAQGKIPNGIIDRWKW